MEQQINKSSSAFLLGLFETGLGVARSLGNAGIKVYGYDHKKDIAYYSKYVKARICPHPKNQEREFIEFLINESNHTNNKPVIYITGDEFIPAVTNNLELLQEHFLINSPNKTLIKSISNKLEQYLLAKKAGINVPKTIIIKNENDIKSLINELAFPIFIKGLDSNSWRKVFGGSKKGFVFNNKEELLSNTELFLKKGIDTIAQELIEGPDSNHYKFCGYVDKDGILKASFCLRKIRQNPIHFGVGCLVESVNNNELTEIGKKFFFEINYRGVGSAEFKLDERDKKYKLIELNPRYWQQNYLSTFCGVNFPLIQYFDLTNQPVKETLNYKTGIKWVNIYADFDSFLAYRKEGSLNFIKWLQSLKGKKVFSDWATNDIKPGFYEFRFGKRLFKLPFYLVKRMR